MTTARSRHTATLLLDGRVLVAGGRTQVASGRISTASAELYNPSTGAWTGSLSRARDFHAATLLSDGRVLVTGGITVGVNGNGAEKSAEIYNPNTGLWSKADHLANPRFGHTATSLPDGKILVAGGAGAGGDCESVRTTEIYDPVTDTWKPAAPMDSARGFYAALLLQNGRVAVFGGNTLPVATCVPTATAELYNDASNNWTAAASMTFSRTGHTISSLTDGRILVAGGRSFDGSVYGSVAAAEIYNPADGSWSAAPDMNAARAYHTTTLLPDGRILVAGGHANGSFFADQLSTAELYSP